LRPARFVFLRFFLSFASRAVCFSSFFLSCVCFTGPDDVLRQRWGRLKYFLKKEIISSLYRALAPHTGPALEVGRLKYSFAPELGRMSAVATFTIAGRDVLKF
jgi:hypothetical protein